MKALKQTALSLSMLALAGQLYAIEYPVGEPVEKNGMEIVGVYLQPVSMEHSNHESHHLSAADADIHLEADIAALANNANGFEEGSWVPYLTVNYKLEKLDGSNWVQKGPFMPMVANDGPHYGDNIKLNGPGKYRVTFNIAPPTAFPAANFGRHTDKETGVAEWWEAFDVSWEFPYAGIGKKGGY